MKRNKRKWKTPIFVIVITGMLLIGYIITIVFLFQKYTCRSEAIVGAVSGGISFIGTIFLGTISFWQTRTANDISQTQLRRELITHIIPKPDVEVRQIPLAIKEMINEFPNLSLEGIFCSTDSLEAIDEKEKRNFFEFTFQFQTEGAPLEKICPIEIKVNRELSATKKNLFADLKIVYPNDNAIFVYNPTCTSFIFKIYINAPLDILELASQNKIFILDITVNVVSIYGTVQKHSWSINFDDDIIHFKDLKDNKISKEKFYLKNIIIHTGEPKYVK